MSGNSRQAVMAHLMKRKESERRSRRGALKERKPWLPYVFDYIENSIKSEGFTVLWKN